MGYQGVKPSTPLAELREVCVAGPYNTRCAGAVGVAGDGLQRFAVFRLLAVLLEYHYYCLMCSLYVLLTTVQFYMETLFVFE